MKCDIRSLNQADLQQFKFCDRQSAEPQSIEAHEQRLGASPRLGCLRSLRYRSLRLFGSHALTLCSTVVPLRVISTSEFVL